MFLFVRHFFQMFVRVAAKSSVQQPLCPLIVCWMSHGRPSFSGASISTKPHWSTPIIKWMAEQQAGIDFAAFNHKRSNQELP
ncbi:MAG TPA: hypothetical protein VH593_19105, partial [Ktedonobacteraceae bacterium]